MNYVRKNIPFDLSKPNEKQLWEWLKTQPHGAFAEETKRFWNEKMIKTTLKKE
ncbi:hypothetical protein [Paenibacillus sp. UNC451MF]|uniref:hypothetical protein n=1 Tax=Paenibacillus sp. UNC451MF TaxID=1449063 RepID=UPI000AFF0B2F|nr:hypothetical protein [Paenibacillus sp. UNC451MF]